MAFALAAPLPTDVAFAASTDGPIVKRHTGVTRENATKRPRSEDDQAVIGGWPLYRNERGQQAFNQSMATLRATESPAPAPNAFAGCSDLMCGLDLPKLSASGWMPAGRLWISPTDYIVLVRSPRPPRRRGYRRRASRDMRVFVFHEFLNGTRNVDVYDTISAHKRSVFTPFYMSKPRRDAQGRRFVMLIQVAPHNVVSRHAANFGNRGSGIEVAKNYGEKLNDLQAKAGIVIAAMVKNAAPKLRVVRHRGKEGLPMLRAYQRWVRASRGGRTLKLPFVPAERKRVARATAALADLIWTGRKRAPARVASAAPAPRTTLPPSTGGAIAAPAPRLVHTAPSRRPVRYASAMAMPSPVPAPRLIAPPMLAGTNPGDPVRGAAKANDRSSLGALIRGILDQ